LSGLFDLRPLRETSLASLLPESESALAELSPVRRPPSCPVHLFTGELETAEFRRQAEAMLKAVQDRGGEATDEALPGLHHYSIVLALADARSPPSRRIDVCLGLSTSA
jgi:arylformamidase